MKALTSIALVLLLCSCQKEIMFPPEPQAVIVKEVPAKEVNYREEPSQPLRMSEFAPMLWEDKQYTITEYYCVKRNLWDSLPSWVKDDVYTFNESGNVRIDANLIQSPTVSFETTQKVWHLYVKDNEMKLDWINENYDPETYSVVAYELEKSFTLCSKVNDSKIFTTYTIKN